MSRVGLDSIDILLDENGQPVSNMQGDFETVENENCWLQDIRNEALTEEGELFYEDSESIERYGFGLADFINTEHDDFFENEVNQRIKDKLSLRDDIDERTIISVIKSNDSDIEIEMKFKRNNSEDEYNMEVGTNEIEVTIDD